MRKHVKRSLFVLLGLLIILASFFAYKDFPKENSLLKKVSVWFRFDFGGRDRYYDRYYDRYNYRYDHYDYVRVGLEIHDDDQEHVDEVYIDGRKVYDSYYRNRSFNLSLRPGIYTIRWKVTSKKNLWKKERMYAHRFRISYYDRWMTIVIKGDRIYIH